jgi:hypothetical protein
VVAAIVCSSPPRLPRQVNIPAAAAASALPRAQWRRSGFDVALAPTIVGIRVELSRRAEEWESVVAQRYQSEAEYAQELCVLEHLARTLSLSARRSFVRERFCPRMQPPPAFRALLEQNYLELRPPNTQQPNSQQAQPKSQQAPPKKKRRRDSAHQWVPDVEANEHCWLMFPAYAGTLNFAIRSRPADEGDSYVNPRGWRELRIALFWAEDASGKADEAAMEHKTCTFVLHCLEGLLVHHQAHVLLGDITPRHLYFHAGSEGRPVFGGYASATHMHAATANSTSKIISRRHLPFGPLTEYTSTSRYWERGYRYVNGQLLRIPKSYPWPSGQSVNSRNRATFRAAAGMLDESMGETMMIGMTRDLNVDIGSLVYRAEETRSVPSPPLRGICSERTDVYALCASIVDILVGDLSRVDLAFDSSFERRERTDLHRTWVEGQSLQEEWLCSGGRARVPEWLNSLIHKLHFVLTASSKLSTIIQQIKLKLASAVAPRMSAAM